MLRSARAALASLSVSAESPFVGADLNAKLAVGGSEGDVAARFAFWESRAPGTRVGDDRYRWEISHKRCRPAPHVPPVDRWAPFRLDVEPDPARMELRLSLPISIAENAEYLARVGERHPALRAHARALLDEALPLFRRDLAQYVLGTHPWTDTFALFALVRRPRALEELRPLAIALASVYASALSDDRVLGLRFPFADTPLASATAQLAWGLLRLGLEVPRLSGMVRAVASMRRASGAWGDGDAPDDVLVTLPCLELLSRVDPSFDSAPTLAWLLSRQTPSGFFSVLGPEAPWLTRAIVELAEDLAQPFAHRFRWPQIPAANLDRKTGLPFYAYFDDLARLMSELDGLRDVTTEVAFIDLARFREFNNRFGQDMGDLVLAHFAEALRELPAAAVVRDGGDEMLVIGAPTRGGLASDLDAWRRAWPERFCARFGDEAPPVAPRILVAKTPGRGLRETRERLGQSVGALKQKSKDVGPEGALDELPPST